MYNILSPYSELTRVSSALPIRSWNALLARSLLHVSLGENSLQIPGWPWKSSKTKRKKEHNSLSLVPLSLLLENIYSSRTLYSFFHLFRVGSGTRGCSNHSVRRSLLACVHTWVSTTIRSLVWPSLWALSRLQSATALANRSTTTSQSDSPQAITARTPVWNSWATRCKTKTNKLASIIYSTILYKWNAPLTVQEHLAGLFSFQPIGLQCR